MASNLITTPLSDRQLGKVDDVLPFLNKEVTPLLREMRAALNSGQSGTTVTGDTSDSVGVLKEVWESDTAPTVGTWSIHARAVLSDSNSEGAAYFLAATYRMVAGAPTLVASTAIYTPHESTGAFDWQWNTTATTVTLSLQDAGVAAGYTLVIELLEATA